MSKKPSFVVFGANIKALRELKNLLQEDIRLHLGVSRQTVNTWENKVKVKMEPGLATKLADFLGVTTKDLSIQAPMVDQSKGNDWKDKYYKKIEQDLEECKQENKWLKAQLEDTAKKNIPSIPNAPQLSKKQK